VRTGRHQPSLSSPLRVPDSIQADALRVLDPSREVITLTVTALWDRRDACATRTNRHASTQMEEMMDAPVAHGHRHWRAEAEQAGRILRGQAERKKLCAMVLPLLEQGMIQRKTEKWHAGNNRKAITQAGADRREANAAGGRAVELQSLMEHACTVSLENGCFPDTSEEMQDIPVLKAGIVPSASDDGPQRGQTSRLALDLDQKSITLALRTPNARGTGGRSWRDSTCQMSLPDVLVARLKEGTPHAPTLREIVEADGTRSAVLDVIVVVAASSTKEWEACHNVIGFDWGGRKRLTVSAVALDGHQIGRPFFLDTGPFDGRHARLRRQIDQRKANVAVLEKQRDRFPVGDPRCQPAQSALSIVRRDISRCWRTYEARKNDLAHLAATMLLVLATAFDGQLRAGDSLKTRKSAGRGRNARGRWRTWRNHSQVRGEWWRVLRSTCFLTGLRLEWQHPRHTSPVCPRCGSPANTFTSPSHREKANDWGAWLCCSNPECLWSGSRDDAASLNIARLGATLIRPVQRTGKVLHPVVRNTSVPPVSSMGTRAALRFPPPALRGRLIHSGRVSCNGWCLSVRLRSSSATSIMLRLCGYGERKRQRAEQSSRF